MKARTNDFKEAIKELKEISSKITYTINGVATELGDEELNSVQPHYQGSLLKSIMKELDLDSNVDIPKETIINYQFGVLVNGSYEYINYGNYVVYSSEKQEDTNSYLLTCYDKMLYSMKDYEKIQYRNLFDKDTENYKKGYYLNSSGVETSGTNWGVYYIPIKPNTSYTISGCQTNGGVQFCWFNSNKTFISAIGQKQDRTNITSPSNAGYIGLSIVWNTTSSAYDGTTFMLQEGSVATDYEPFGDIQYPITIRDYINALCTHIGLTFKNANDYFTNYDKTIEKELYLDENGNSLNYTYRDVLDELAQATASTICINEDDDELEIRYISNAGEQTTNVSGTNLSITSEDSQTNEIELLGDTTQSGTPTPSSPQEVQNITGLQEVKCVGKNLYNSNDTTYYSACTYVSGANTNQYKVKATGTDVIINAQVASGSSYSASAGTLIPCNYGETIYYDIGNANFGKNFITQYNSNKVSLGFTALNTGYSSGSYTPTNSECKYISIRIGYGSATSGTEYTLAPIISKSSNLTYEPYQEQVNEINLGKNLFIPTTQVSGTDIVVANGTVTLNNDEFTLNATGNDCYFGQVSASGNTYTNNSGILIDVSGMTNVTFSLTNTQFNNIYITAYNNSKTSLGYTNFTSYKGTYTIPTNAKYISIRFGLSNAVSGTSYSTKVQIEKGTQATLYSEYFTPIELCKIGTYEDKIFKNSGKNLFDGELEVGSLDQSSGSEISATNRVRSKNYNVVNNSTQYTINAKTSISNKYIQSFVFEYDTNNNFIQRQSSNWTLLPFTFTTSATTKKVRILLSYSDGSTTTINDFYDVMLNKGNTATEYEPYGSGEWYVKKAIGKVVLNGSESWGRGSSATTRSVFSLSTFTDRKTSNSLSDFWSDKFAYVGNAQSTDLGYAMSFNTGVYSNYLYIQVPTNIVASGNIANFQTWLGTHNTIVYYVLATPTYTKLNDTLQEQLNSIRLLEGTNNVMSSVPIDLTYVSGIDTLDEEYFNEDNVNFGEMYGPVNTIILSRSAESDEIAQSIPNNLSDDEKVAIKIKENQIMNFNNRDEYLYGILTRLYGLRYTQNDYSSKGICYYNVCDRYKATIFGKDYYCVMLNDDVTIESGLSENVFTELPEIAETDYSKTTTSDRIERQTNLIVDKQTGEIRAEISTIDDQLNGANGISSKLTAQGETLELWQKSFDDNGNVIALNTTNYTFDSEGLKIGKSTDDYNSLQDNTGTYYYEKDTMIGKYTKDGSVQKDLALFGKYYYGIDEKNFDVSSFTRDDALFLAQLYTDSNNEDGFGHFWNGE